MSTAQHVVISMLPAKLWKPGAFAVEWLADDGTDTPWACHLSPDQSDRAAAAEDAGRDWRAAVYESLEPALELPAYLRFVESLPCLEPYSDSRGSKG